MGGAWGLMEDLGGPFQRTPEPCCGVDHHVCRLSWLQSWPERDIVVLWRKLMTWKPKSYMQISPEATSVDPVWRY